MWSKTAGAGECSEHRCAEPGDGRGLAFAACDGFSASRGPYVAGRNFGIPSTVAETSQPKHARPGKEIDTQILERGVQMKRLFLGSVALVALGLGMPGAFAADRPVPAYAPPPPPPPAYTWSGCYAGASAGTSNGTSTHYTTAGSVLTPNTALPAAAIGANITDSFNLSG